ncbi:MAG: hypothetical protein EBX62_06500, partial [Betaproteobacteria bacterium]|nr:hypothetical protein [Betaproteobacteria bacterium]
MASAKAVAVGLATLHEAFPTRPITAQTADVWARLFAEVGDDAFLETIEGQRPLQDGSLKVGKGRWRVVHLTEP